MIRRSQLRDAVHVIKSNRHAYLMLKHGHGSKETQNKHVEGQANSISVNNAILVAKQNHESRFQPISSHTKAAEMTTTLA
jgi:hypothetical protein